MPLPPGFTAPCLPTKAPHPATGALWVHEIKHDGFRVIARKDGDRVRLYKHAKSYIVELEGDSAWRIWPGDLATSLHWMPTTQFEVSEIDDDHCTHALIDRTTGTRVRVIEAAATFAPQEIEASLIR